jgi:hypothetical protein
LWRSTPNLTFSCSIFVQILSIDQFLLSFFNLSCLIFHQFLLSGFFNLMINLSCLRRTKWIKKK